MPTSDCLILIFAELGLYCVKDMAISYLDHIGNYVDYEKMKTKKLFGSFLNTKVTVFRHILKRGRSFSEVGRREHRTKKGKNRWYSNYRWTNGTSSAILSNVLEEAVLTKEQQI